MVYGTAITYENNEVHFYNDIYGQDARLSEALRKGYPIQDEIRELAGRGPKNVTLLTAAHRLGC